MSHGPAITFLRAFRHAEALLLFALQTPLSRMARAILSRHPDILERMHPHAGAAIIIAPAGAPIVFRLRPLAAEPVEILRRADARDWDARVTAPLSSLMAMAQGTRDGDALFFSGQVAIEGDTSAVLALRNALDAAEIDLTREFCRPLGPLGAPAEHVMRRLLMLMEWRTDRRQTAFMAVEPWPR